MQVIGSGFGRTGTGSLKVALEQLGFGPCYHMDVVIKDPPRFEAWNKLAQGGSADWDAIFEGFESTVDFPACQYYKELMAAYPDAKVIHTVRDPKRWYESFYETIYYGKDMFPGWMTKLIKPLQNMEGMMDDIWNNLFEGQLENPDRMVEIFDEYTAEVKATVPPEKLLVFEVKDGWEPLCNFLGVEVPEGDFPRVHDRESFRRRITTIKRATRIIPVVILVAIVLLLLLIFF